MAESWESIVSLLKAFNASIERGFVPHRPRESYKTLATEAAEFSNRERISDVEARLMRLEIRCQELEKASRMPQNRAEMPLKTPLLVEKGGHTPKKKGNTR
jgi:hypothetical protein